MQTMVKVHIQASETAVITFVFIELQVQRVKELTHKTRAFILTAGFLWKKIFCLW